MQTLHTTETKTRFDIYRFVHKGLRAYMADVLTTLGRADYEDSVEIAASLAQVRSLLELCRAHLFAENQFLHTAMESRRPGSSGQTANEHVRQEELVEAIEARLRFIERSSQASLEANVHELYRTLAVFVGDNFQHMEAEERDNNATLQALYTDAELLAIHKELVQSMDPDTMKPFLRWMLPNISPSERARLLAGMRRDIPEPVVERLLAEVATFQLA